MVNVKSSLLAVILAGQKPTEGYRERTPKVASKSAYMRIA